MSDVITTIPNPEEQASYPHDDEVSFGPSLQPAGDSSAENLLPGNALATTKHASLLSRFKGKIFKRGNRGEPAFNMAPSPDHQANQVRSQLAAVIELQQRLVEEINRLKKHLAAAEAQLRICDMERARLEGGRRKESEGN
ncbi:hypothetical protein XANCAGTX0491_001347 [Xanthoria calcicola]